MICLFVTFLYSLLVHIICGMLVCLFVLFCFLFCFVFFFSDEFFYLHQQDFFRKLMGLFRICEDLENVDGLHMLYKIVRGISKYSFDTILSTKYCT